MKYWQFNEHYTNIFNIMMVIGFALALKGCQIHFGVPEYLKKGTHNAECKAAQ